MNDLLEAAKAVIAVSPESFEVTGYDGDGETTCLYCGGKQIDTAKAIAYSKAMHAWQRRNPKPYIDIVKRREQLAVTEFLEDPKAVEKSQRKAMKEAMDAEVVWRKHYKAFSDPREPKENEWTEFVHTENCAWVALYKAVLHHG